MMTSTIVYDFTMPDVSTIISDADLAALDWTPHKNWTPVIIVVAVVVGIGVLIYVGNRARHQHAETNEKED